MKKENYKPFYLSEAVNVNDGYYILRGIPHYVSEDIYFEVHIKSNSTLKIIETYVDEWIYIDMLSAGFLEIYTGEYLEESSSDGSIDYIEYSYQEIHKSSEIEYKAKFKDLEFRYNTLLHQRLPLYKLKSNAVAQNYKALYDEFPSKKNNILNEAGSIFEHLYRFFTPDCAYVYYLNSLVAKTRIKELTLFKDWKEQYLDLETRYETLSQIDLNDYSVIKDQLTHIYRSSFYYMLRNLSYNHKNIDEQKYIKIFESIIEMLNKTTA